MSWGEAATVAFGAVFSIGIAVMAALTAARLSRSTRLDNRHDDSPEPYEPARFDEIVRRWEGR